MPEQCEVVQISQSNAPITEIHKRCPVESELQEIMSVVVDEAHVVSHWVMPSASNMER